jgi:hypothetical protein
MRCALFTGCAAVLIAIPATAIASHGEDAEISLNPDHEGSLATDAEEGCDEFGGSAGENSDGWVFVLPAQGDPDAHFNSVTATFEDEEGNEVTRDATLVDGSGGNKAIVVTPAGWTLISATASINTTEPDMVDSFNLTHACPGVPEEPTEEPTTPGEETTTPGDETTSPMAADTTTPKSDESPAPSGDSPQPDRLNQTGNDLTVLLAAAAALVFAGIGALYLVRRRFGRID